MTPTEQDKMSDEELYQSITDICFENGGVTKPMADKLMQLTTADRKRVALEARLDERQMLSFHRAYGRDYQATLETLEEANDKRIAELKRELDK